MKRLARQLVVGLGLVAVTALCSYAAKVLLVEPNCPQYTWMVSVFTFVVGTYIGAGIVWKVQ